MSESPKHSFLPQLRPTVCPAANFDAAADAQALRKAMKGFGTQPQKLTYLYTTSVLLNILQIFLSVTFTGTDEDAIIDIVAQRSNAQRQEIRQTFKSLLGRVGLQIINENNVFIRCWANSTGQLWLFCPQDLMKDLKSELSKNLERLIIGLMLTPAEFDAKMMKKAMEVRLMQITVRLHVSLLQTFVNECVHLEGKTGQFHLKLISSY